MVKASIKRLKVAEDKNEQVRLKSRVFRKIHLIDFLIFVIYTKLMLRQSGDRFFKNSFLKFPFVYREEDERWLLAKFPMLNLTQLTVL